MIMHSRFLENCEIASCHNPATCRDIHTNSFLVRITNFLRTSYKLLTSFNQSSSTISHEYTDGLGEVAQKTFQHSWKFGLIGVSQLVSRSVEGTRGIPETNIVYRQSVAVSGIDSRFFQNCAKWASIPRPLDFILTASPLLAHWLRCCPALPSGSSWTITLQSFASPTKTTSAGQRISSINWHQSRKNRRI